MRLRDQRSFQLSWTNGAVVRAALFVIFMKRDLTGALKVGRKDVIQKQHSVAFPVTIHCLVSVLKWNSWKLSCWTVYLRNHKRLQFSPRTRNFPASLPHSSTLRSSCRVSWMPLNIPPPQPPPPSSETDFPIHSAFHESTCPSRPNIWSSQLRRPCRAGGSSWRSVEAVKDDDAAGSRLIRCLELMGS